jgi:hypothetical protein
VHFEPVTKQANRHHGGMIISGQRQHYLSKNSSAAATNCNSSHCCHDDGIIMEQNLHNQTYNPDLTTLTGFASWLHQHVLQQSIQHNPSSHTVSHTT